MATHSHYILPRLLHLSDPHRCFVTVHLRHLDVHENDRVLPVFLQLIKRLLPRVRRVTLHSNEGPYHWRERKYIEVLVVNDKYGLQFESIDIQMIIIYAGIVVAAYR